MYGAKVMVLVAGHTICLGRMATYCSRRVPGGPERIKSASLPLPGSPKRLRSNCINAMPSVRTTWKKEHGIQATQVLRLQALNHTQPLLMGFVTSSMYAARGAAR